MTLRRDQMVGRTEFLGGNVSKVEVDRLLINVLHQYSKFPHQHGWVVWFSKIHKTKYLCRQPCLNAKLAMILHKIPCILYISMCTKLNNFSVDSLNVRGECVRLHCRRQSLAVVLAACSNTHKDGHLNILLIEMYLSLENFYSQLTINYICTVLKKC